MKFTESQESQNSEKLRIPRCLCFNYTVFTSLMGDVCASLPSGWECFKVFQSLDICPDRAQP
jgi:hypothetical protein